MDEAIALYRKALAVRPRWTEGWWSLGTLQYDRNAYTEAAKAFQKVIALGPRAGTAQAMLGLCEFELGHEDSALVHLVQGRKLGVAKDKELQQVVLYHEGVLLQRKGSFRSARDTLYQLCLAGVQNQELDTTLGLVSLRLRTKTVPAPPNADVIGQIGRASCLAGQKKFDEARQVFAALVNEHPDYPNIHTSYGQFLLEAHDMPAAVEEFKLEIKNQPTDIFSRLQIAAAHYKTNSAVGLPYAEEAVKLSPHLAFAHYLLGVLLLDVDDYARAIPELEFAQKAFPADPRIYLALGSAYSRAGHTQDAERARAGFQKLSGPTGQQERTELNEETVGATDLK